MSAGVLQEGLTCIQQIPLDYKETIPILLPLLKLTMKQLLVVAEWQKCPLSPPCDTLAQDSATVIDAKISPVVLSARKALLLVPGGQTSSTQAEPNMVPG